MKAPEASVNRPEPPLVSIVISSAAESDQMNRCLAAVHLHTPQPFELILPRAETAAQRQAFRCNEGKTGNDPSSDRQYLLPLQPKGHFQGRLGGE